MVMSGEHRYDAFLSYARADAPDFGQDLSEGLARMGCRVWFDRESMPNRGTTFGQEIRRAIESSDRLVLLATPGALASPYVDQEWRYADAIGKPVVPVVRSVGFGELPERLSHYHAVDAERQPVDVVVAELARLLSEPVQALGPCFHLPGQPPHARERAALSEHLAHTLLSDRLPPRDAGQSPRVAALYGVPGSGKSTVAAAFAAATRTRRVFSDGIVWLTAGPEFQPLAAARELLRLTAPGARLPESDLDLDICLAGALDRRELLIVLDDVRDPDPVVPFVNALGPGAHLLLTTLDQAVATALGAVQVAVGRFDEDEGREFLADWAGGGPLPAEADVVLEACDGLPFALAIVGAMIANRARWEDVAQALDARRLDELVGRFPGYPHRTVLAVLAASLEALTADDPRAAECYLELAGLQPGAVLSPAVLQRLWSRNGRLTPLEARLVLPVLERRLLLQSLPDGSGFRLHGLHEDFVRIRHPDPTGLERDLIATYRADKGSSGWAELTDDGYVFDHLVGHLAALDDLATVFEVVTREWAQRQWERRGDLGQALDDARRAIDLAVRPPVDLVNVARLSVLAGQIVSTLRRASPELIGAMAETGDVDRALRWAGAHPDAPERFTELLMVAQVLLDNGELTMARKVCRVAAETIPALGGTVESGILPSLTGLNAVHALVHFPHPDQWEGTQEAQVAIAREPLDAVVRLAPLAAQAGAVAELMSVTNPSWELYGHLIPLVAVEELAQIGEVAAGRALLDAYRERPVREEYERDLVNAARYRYAVALAALGEFDTARTLVDRLPSDYRTVGLRGLARSFARAGQVDEATALLDAIDDPVVVDETLLDIIDAVAERGRPDECRSAAGVAKARGNPEAAALLSAMAGDVDAGRGFLEAGDAGTALGVGVGVATVHWAHGARSTAVHLVRELVPIAEELLGPQWWAPELVDTPPGLAEAAGALASLLIRIGEPLPSDVATVAPGVEILWGRTPTFKLGFVRDLAAGGRLPEALELAELPAAPGGRALCLANALAVTEPTADPSLAEQVGDAADRLAEELRGKAVGGRTLDALVAAVLADHGLDGPLAPLAAAVTARADLPLAQAARARLLARAGRPEEVRRWLRTALEDQALSLPVGRARGMVLTAVAARRTGPSAELAAMPGLLADPWQAAAALDIVAEVIDLYARNVSLEAAAHIARTVPAGPEAELADALLSKRRLSYSADIPDTNIAAVAAVRATAAAAMALVTARAGRRRKAKRWLRTCERFLEGAEWVSPSSHSADHVARYLWAARVVLDPAAEPGSLAAAAQIAWYLWDRGHPEAAAHCARTSLDRLLHPLVAGLVEDRAEPHVRFVEDFMRDSDVHGAGRASLIGLLARAAAADGDQHLASELVSGVDLSEAKSLPSLTYAEAAEFRAALALGLHAAGRSEDAHELLRYALSESLIMARRGELAPFERLSEAVVELLPAEDAHTIWTHWLQEAAQQGVYATLGMIACYVRRLPEETLRDMVVNPETGDLERLASSMPVSAIDPAAPA